MLIDRSIFYIAYREQFGSIGKTKVVENINTMLTALEAWQELLNSTVLCQQLAYIAATALHETGGNYGTWKEIRQERVDTLRRKEVRRLQDRYWSSGYYGRGPVQLTWEANYAWAQKATGRPLLHDPDLLLHDLPLGYEVAVKGMAYGSFTGLKLNDYINYAKCDYIGARKIINGSDMAITIAGYANKFYTVFSKAIRQL